jgi:flagellar M-ring protein FliF
MADAPKATNQVLQVGKQLKELWEKQPKGRRTLAVLVVLGVLGFVGITAFLKKTETWKAIGEGMSPADAQQVSSMLLERGINARLKDGNVEVESEDINEAVAIARVSAATSGLSSMAKEFDSEHLGRTSFDEQVAYKRAIEGELARQIITTDSLQSASVHVAFGKKSAIKDMEALATASVMVAYRVGAPALTPEQVMGIRSLVASSVENLDASKVVVVGPKGILDGTEKASSGGNTSDLEALLAKKVLAVVGTMVGEQHVRVIATAEMDTSKVNSIEHQYDKDRAVVRSQARTIDGQNPLGTGTQQSIGGVAGTQGNLPGAPAPSGSGASTGSGGNGHLTESTNYEISDKTIQTEMPEQKIKKLHLAVLIDEDKDKAGKPVPRTKEQMDKIAALSRGAVGLDDARGDTFELASAPFAAIEIPEEPAPPKPLLPVPVPVAIGGGVGALVLIAVIVLLLKSRGKKNKAGKTQALVLKSGAKLSFPTPVAELERVLDHHPDALPTKESLGLPAGRTAQERVMDVVRADVERAAGVLTGWLAEAPVAAKGK